MEIFYAVLVLIEVYLTLLGLPQNKLSIFFKICKIFIDFPIKKLFISVRSYFEW